MPPLLAKFNFVGAGFAMLPTLIVNSWAQVTLPSVSQVTGLTGVCYPPHLIVVFTSVSLVTMVLDVSYSLVNSISFKGLFFFMWMVVWQYVYLCFMCMLGTCWDQKRTSDPLEVQI